MKIKKRIIKPSEARMLQSMKRTPRTLSINQLANKSNLSWATTNKYLRKWRTKGLVKPVMKPAFSHKLNKLTKKKQWMLNRSVLSKIVKKTR